MELFRSILHRNQQDRHIDTSDWVFVESPSPPPPPPPMHRAPRRLYGRMHAANRSNLKPLHWTKINKALPESLREELQTHEKPHSSSEIDVSELEKLFCNNPPNKACFKDTEKKRDSISMPETSQVIQPFIANSTEIMLTEVPSIITTKNVSVDVCEKSNAVDIHKLEVNPKDLLGDNIIGFVLEPPPLSQDHIYPSLQLVEDVDLKNKKVKHVDLKCKIGGPAVKRSNLVPLHWTKVNTKNIQGTLWDELQRQSSPDVDVSEIESLFSNRPVKNRKAASSYFEKVQLIDMRKVNNTEIMLTKIKLPLPDMVDAILAMDELFLDLDQVENILKFCPTKEEMEQLKNYTGDLEKLGKCEHFFLELMKVPRVEAKLNVFMFKIQFTYQLADLKKSLNIVNSACDEVRTSVKFKEIMNRILYLGNTLNQGTCRGSAVGFKLDSLLKLTDTRAANSQISLLHYLCKSIHIKEPTLLEFPEDLVNLEAASKIQLKSLEEEMQALTIGLKICKQELDASANDGPVSKDFPAKLKRFVAHADSEMADVTHVYSSMCKNADGLALYFGENPKRCPLEQAFLIILTFVRLFKHCIKENLVQAELKRRKSLEGNGNGVV